MERCGNNIRVVESCEVASHPVFLYSERVHRRGVVLFHALVSHSVYSHPARTNVFLSTSRFAIPDRMALTL